MFVEHIVLPSQNQTLEEIYEGKVHLTKSNLESEELVRLVNERLTLVLGDEPRKAQFEMSDKDFFEKLKPIRSEFYKDEFWHKKIGDVLRGFDWDVDQLQMDPMRLRVVAHDGHLNPRAQSVYYPHRDTWYGHAQELITWWIPLDDLSLEETFDFYPDYFSKKVMNDSEVFDYNIWVKKQGDLKTGWQDRDAGVREKYPSSLEESLPDNNLEFFCGRGDNLLFSGHQYHMTKKQSIGKTRFSLDFRIINIDDFHQKKGPENIDNKSKGCAFSDFIKIP